jgi:hypothetical protein
MAAQPAAETKRGGKEGIEVRPVRITFASPAPGGAQAHPSKSKFPGLERIERMMRENSMKVGFNGYSAACQNAMKWKE